MSDGLTKLALMHDSEDMIGLTRSFVNDIRTGFSMLNNGLIPWLDGVSKQPWKGVLCLGMGGSAAGGDFLSSLCDRYGRIPVRVTRGYELPNWWNEHWLIIATSYSGNTEETVTAVRESIELRATIIVISSGGELAGLAEMNDKVHLITVPAGQPPRTAFGHLFSRQLGLFEYMGFLPAQIDEEGLNRLQSFNEEADIISNPDGSIPSLALSLAEGPIAALGPIEMGPVLIRFKNQANENASRFVRIGEIPEMNHNEVVAWGGVGDDSDPYVEQQNLLLFTWDHMSAKVQHRFDWFVAHCPTKTVWRVHGEGSTLVEAYLHHCLTMDWLTIALALVHGKDPSSIDPIISLKQYLQSIET